MTSKIKVDNITNQSDSNIVNKCGTTITLGASGDTINLASGASQTGFGRTGTVNWNTTAITADPANAVSGTGYFADTTSSAFTITLPTSPSAGDIVAISDYANNFATNNLTVGRNGSNIEGNASDYILNQSGVSVTLVYVDATKGWIVTNAGNSSQGFVSDFIIATGGTITCCGDYRIHTFTGPGTFTVTCAGTPANANVDYLIIGGGGAAGATGAPTRYSTGGGGAGGFRESSGAASGCYTTSPLGSGVSALPVSVQGYPITVGAGSSGSSDGTNPIPAGSPSIFSSITSAGGGSAGSNEIVPSVKCGQPGGSGGGAATFAASGGTGNTPPVSPPQGNNGGATGGSGPNGASAGGGGAGAVGGASPACVAGAGGNGVSTSISGSSTAYAGGGGGGTYFGPYCTNGAVGGTGGGGDGGPLVPVGRGNNGTANTGGGAGGTGSSPGTPQAGATGGSGIVIIRYKFQN